MVDQPHATIWDQQVVAWLIEQSRLRPFSLIGVQGPQGSGKTTRCRWWQQALTTAGVASAVVALDDFYLTRNQRRQLATQVHPLLASRGVPGTHDLPLLKAALIALAEQQYPLTLPQFDKARDDRSSTPQQLNQPVTLVMLEGWCVAVPPQQPAALIEPVNGLEAAEDSDGRWRTYVNDQLAGPYAELWQRLDRTISLEIPDFSYVQRWRGEQELALKASNHPTAGFSNRQLERFIAHFERLTRHAMATMPSRADLRLFLGDDHQPTTLISR